jgi:hypothetical protein
MKTIYGYLGLFVLSIVLYLNTLQHVFVLDDRVVVLENTFVQSGIAGLGDIFSNDSFAGFKSVGAGQTMLEGGRYRPLSLALFAVVHSVLGLNTMVFHGLSILLYAVLVVILYRSLGYMLKEVSHGPTIALAASALFAVHPVHTEVVANVKSCDETLALLFGMLAVYSLFRGFDRRSLLWSAGAGILFLLACFSKENAITLVLLAPLSLWFFRKSTRAEIVKSSIPFVLSAIGFMIIRSVVLGNAQAMQMAADPLNNPFLKWNGNSWIPFTVSEQLATILFTFWEYIRLLVVPHPLTHNYYSFAVDAQDFGKPGVLAGLAVLAGMVIFLIWRWKKKEPWVYYILFFLVALSPVINLFFPIGTYMAERFLFMPSLAFCLGVGSLFSMVWHGKYRILAGVSGTGVLIVFSILTIQRNKAWKDITTLLQTDIAVSSKSVKLQNDYGTVLLSNALAVHDPAARKKQMEEAASHLKKALELHPTYYDAYLAYGASSYYAGHFEQSVWAYNKAYELNPEDQKSLMGLFYALQGYGNDEGEKGNTELAIKALTSAYEIQQDTSIMRQIERLKTK